MEAALFRARPNFRSRRSGADGNRYQKALTRKTNDVRLIAFHPPVDNVRKFRRQPDTAEGRLDGFARRLSEHAFGDPVTSIGLVHRGAVGGVAVGELQDALDPVRAAAHEGSPAGKTNQQIAEELVLFPFTVAKHVANVLAKTGAANRTDAVFRAGHSRA